MEVALFPEKRKVGSSILPLTTGIFEVRIAPEQVKREVQAVVASIVGYPFMPARDYKIPCTVARGVHG
jgi:hypothetical protein